MSTPRMAGSGFSIKGFDPRDHQAPRESYDFSGFDPRQHGADPARFNFGGFNPSHHGNPDMGRADIDHLKGQGASDYDISEYIRGFGGGVGDYARDFERRNTQAPQKENAIGQQDIDHLRSRGASDYDIAEHIRGFGGTVGDAARNFERSNTQAPQNENAIGQADIDHLKGRGISDYAISEYIRNFSGTVGPAARDYASQHTQAPASAPDVRPFSDLTPTSQSNSSSTAQSDNNAINNYWNNVNNSSSNNTPVTNFEPDSVGGRGIGQQDLTELSNQGYSHDAITEFTSNYAANDGTVGQTAADITGVDARDADVNQQTISNFKPNEVGGAGIGQKDIDALVGSGLSQNEVSNYIQSYSQNGGIVGEAAANYAGIEANYGGSATSSVLNDFNPDNVGGDGIGQQDIDTLTSQGFTPNAIQQYITNYSNEGGVVGPAAAEYAGVNPNYGNQASTWSIPDNQGSGEATEQSAVDKGLFNFQGIMDQFYDYQPGENDAAGNAMKNAFATDMIQSAFSSTLANQMSEKQTQLAQSTMTQGADLELRNTDAFMQKQYEQGLGSMGMQYDLQNRFAGNQHARDVAMLEATGVDQRATLGETGQQNRLQRITEGEQDRLTDSNKIQATGAETRAIDSNKIQATGQEQRAGIETTGEQARATDTNKIKTTAEEGRKTIGTQSEATQAIERTRAFEERATDTNQLRTSGQEQRAGIRTTGEENRAGIRTTGEETRATDTNQLRTSGQEQRATIGTQSDASQAIERTRAFEQRATDTNQLRTSGQEQRAGIRTTGEETRATDSNRLRTTGEETRATDSNRLATEGTEQRRTIGTQGDQNVRLVTAKGDDTRDTMSLQSRLDAKRYEDQGRSSRRLSRAY